jgi:AmmeMemoRadiSam system protein B
VLAKNKKLNKVILIDDNYKTKNNEIILPEYKQFETPFGNIHTIQDDELINQNFKLIKDNSYFNKNSKIEVQLPFIRAILNIEYFLPIIVSKKCKIEIFEKLLENIYKQDKNTAIIIL